MNSTLSSGSGNVLATPVLYAYSITLTAIFKEHSLMDCSGGYKLPFSKSSSVTSAANVYK